MACKCKKPKVSTQVKVQQCQVSEAQSVTEENSGLHTFKQSPVAVDEIIDRPIE